MIEPGSEEKSTHEVESGESVTPAVVEPTKATKVAKGMHVPETTEEVKAPQSSVPSEAVIPPVEVTAAEAVPPAETNSPPEAPVEGGPVLTPRATSVLRVVVALVVLVIAVAAYFFVTHAKNGDNAKIQGKVALSAQELKDVVAAKKLTVYWAGPQTGAKYTLIATTPGIIYVRYLPGGVGLNDTKTLFRAIGTYVQTNAFTVSQKAGKVAGNTGFISADGNAVFYAKGRPTNVYIGIKGQNIEVEVFDPVVDQPLALVLVRGQISLVN